MATFADPYSAPPAPNDSAETATTSNDAIGEIGSSLGLGVGDSPGDGNSASGPDEGDGAPGDGGAAGSGGDGSEPVVINLDGNGVKLTQLSQSNQYFDMANDGYQHRTAWAAAGNAVLFYDLTGTGQLTQRNQVVFTDWDVSAKTDMQALRDVFDTNPDNVLDSADASYA